MSWEPELEELRRREELARRMGGEERVQRQHASGRLTVRERVERLFDAGTFHETGALAGWGTYEDGELAEFLPANVVVGQGRIDGRRAVVQGDDFTVRGGAADAAIWQKMVYAERMASELRLPLVRLVDGTGGGGSVKSLETMGFTYVPFIPGWEVAAANLSEVPVVAAALGPGGRARRGAGGGLALLRDRARHRAAVRGRARRWWRPRWGRRRTRKSSEGRGRRRAPAPSTTQAADEDDALAQVRRFLSYLPPNVWEAPPVADSPDPRERREEELLSIVPRERRQPYKARAHPGGGARPGLAVRDRRVVRAQPDHGARAPRRAAGRRAVLGPQPLRGRADRRRVREAHALRRRVRPVPPAGRELRRPAGVRDRHRGRAPRHDPPRHARAGGRLPGDACRGCRCWCARCSASRARRTARRTGSTCATRGRRATGARCRSRAASRPPTGASWRRRTDPVALRAEIEERLNAVRSPFRTAERFGVEEIIDPRDTRPLLCDWAERAHELVRYELHAGPKRRGLRP